ncbi:MAG: response regulator [Deltaproteobacteria bacterium]|nr:response regulator [Deltaproteobacteria bacterium]
MDEAEKTIVILEPDTDERCVLCGVLRSEGFRTIEKRSLEDITAFLDSSSPLAAILDIDMAEINNRKVRELTTRYPGVIFLGVSTRRFHPDLKDAICYHMYACLRKPVDPDEIIYFISSIYADSNEGGATSV